MDYYEFHIEKARYERKFVINGLSIHDIIQVIKLHPANFHEIFDLRQVNNIYLDTLELKYYDDNVIGADRRMKMRIRWYGPFKGTIDKPVLEIKIKNGLLGNKHSYPLSPFKMDEEMRQKKLMDIFEKSHLPLKVMEHVKSLVPVLMYTYERKYFRSFDKLFRFTIDDKLNYYQFSQLNNSFLNPIANKQEKILELKYLVDFNEEAKNIANTLPFRMTKSSKYVNGISHFYHLGSYQ